MLSRTLTRYPVDVDKSILIKHLHSFLSSRDDPSFLISLLPALAAIPSIPSIPTISTILTIITLSPSPSIPPETQQRPPFRRCRGNHPIRPPVQISQGGKKIPPGFTILSSARKNS